MDNVCRKCRKFGNKLFLKGERCLSPKCSFTRRNYAPGSQGVKGKTVRRSEFGVQLREKQKAKAEYGLREGQFSRFFSDASRAQTATGEELLSLLERRLDNVVYRLGWATSRNQARQFVLHRKIKLNDKIVNIPSVVVKKNDVIEPARKNFLNPQKTTLPSWLKLDAKALQGKVVQMPAREDIETGIDEQLIVEYYNR